MCRHCGVEVASSPSMLKQHLTWCKSLPDSVRDAMDHAAVCESRAGLGVYGGVHASVYRGFRVTAWGLNECRRCGKVVRGWGGELKRHSEHRCSGVAVTWATVDVGGQFEHVTGHGGNKRSVCRHCGTVVRGNNAQRKYHLAWCKSLPDSVRAVMDHAAVCESRAGLGRYGGAHASVYRGFRVTGWGLNECRRCGKVVRGWKAKLSQHSSKACASSGSPPAAAATGTPLPAPHAGNEHPERYGRGLPLSSDASVADSIPRVTSCAARSTKRHRPRDAGSSTDVHNGCKPSRRRQPSVSSTADATGTVLQPLGRHVPQEASRTAACRRAVQVSCARHSDGVATMVPFATVNGGEAWAHGFTTTGGGLQVPLAPMPSRCKRARRVRVSGGWTSGCGGSGSDCSGAMGSGSGAMIV